MVTAYSMFANGGRRVKPTLIDRIQDRYGHTIFRHDAARMPRLRCAGDWKNQPEPQLVDRREQVLDPMTAYQITSMMEGVVQRGTATVRARRSASRSPARPAPPTTRRTPGSSASRPTSWSASIWATTSRAVSAGSATGGHLAAPIAQGFPQARARRQAGDAVQGAGRHQADPRRCQDRHARRPGRRRRTILEAFKPGTAPPDNYSVIGVADADGAAVADGLSPDADCRLHHASRAPAGFIKALRTIALSRPLRLHPAATSIAYCGHPQIRLPCAPKSNAWSKRSSSLSGC